jgi:hypothetical protein
MYLLQMGKEVFTLPKCQKLNFKKKFHSDPLYSYTALEDEVGPDGKRIRPGINPIMIDELTECNSMLSAQRKKRQVCIFGP